MNVLITGVSGFIGSQSAQRLSLSGHRVRGTGRRSDHQDKCLDQYIAANLSSLPQCEKLVQGIDVVLHCAGKAGTWGDYNDYDSANVLATKNLLQASQRSNVRRFINLSSPSIYFQYRHQFDLREEDIPNRPLYAYAQTKLLAERAVQSCHGEDLLTVSLRPRGVVGPGDQNWLPRIIALANAGRLIQPTKGEVLVEFTSISNLLDIIDVLVDGPESNYGTTFNVSNGRPENLWSIVDFALQELGLSPKRKQIPLPIAMAAARASELYHRAIRARQEPAILPMKVGVAAYSMTMSIEHIQSRMGYQPFVTTREAIEDFVLDYLRTNAR